jgi:hypothetical protein
LVVGYAPHPHAVGAVGPGRAQQLEAPLGVGAEHHSELVAGHQGAPLRNGKAHILHNLGAYARNVPCLHVIGVASDKKGAPYNRAGHLNAGYALKGEDHVVVKYGRAFREFAGAVGVPNRPLHPGHPYLNHGHVHFSFFHLLAVVRLRGKAKGNHQHDGRRAHHNAQYREEGTQLALEHVAQAHGQYVEVTHRNPAPRFFFLP